MRPCSPRPLAAAARPAVRAASISARGEAQDRSTGARERAHDCNGRPCMADYDMAWAKVDPDHVPPEIDTTHPSVARVYDAILGGKDNFAVDRAVAVAAVKAMGDAGNGA